VTKLTFEMVDATADRFSAAPIVRLRVRVRLEGEAIDALALHVRVQIEPAGRAYDTDEELLQQELFGKRERWVQSVRPLQWTECAVMLNAFTGETTFDVPIACTYDLQVASSKYASALKDGNIPVRLLFTGTIFRGAQSGFAVEMLSWNSERQGRVPVATWQEAMERVFPGQAWIRVDRPTFAALRRYRTEHALYNWEDAFAHLLGEHAGERT